MTQDNPYGAPTTPQPIPPDRLRIEQQMRGRISWLYWVAGLSVVNSCIAVAGGGTRFIFGLGITQVIDAITMGVAQGANPQAAKVVGIVGLGMSLVCAGLFVLLGYLAMRRSVVAAVLGTALYAADGLLLLFSDWLGVGFHVFVLLMLVGGTQSIFQLRRMDQAAGAAMFGGPQGQQPWPQQQQPWQQEQAWPQQQQSWPQPPQSWPQQPPPSSTPPTGER